MKRDNIPKEEALKIINSQMSIEEKKQKSDFIIENEATIEELQNKVEEFLDNRRRDENKKAEFEKSAVAVVDYPEERGLEFSFIGRSNVGKSSLINSLTNRRSLARTSKTPGRTQLINYFLVNDEIYFVDLPGYGFAKVPEQVRRAWGKQ